MMKKYRWEVRDYGGGSLYVWDSRDGAGLAGTTTLSTHPTLKAARAEVVRLTKLPPYQCLTVREAVGLLEYYAENFGDVVLPQGRGQSEVVIRELKKLLAIGEER